MYCRAMHLRLAVFVFLLENVKDPYPLFPIPFPRHPLAQHARKLWQRDLRAPLLFPLSADEAVVFPGREQVENFPERRLALAHSVG